MNFLRQQRTCRDLRLSPLNRLPNLYVRVPASRCEPEAGSRTSLQLIIYAPTPVKPSYQSLFCPNNRPSIFHDYFTRTSCIHRYETRHNKLYLTHVNTRFGQRILRYKGTQLWNRLPNNLSNNTASQSFRNKLKLLLICDPM